MGSPLQDKALNDDPVFLNLSDCCWFLFETGCLNRARKKDIEFLQHPEASGSDVGEGKMKPPKFDPRKKVKHDSIKAIHKKCVTHELDNCGDALRHGHLDHLKNIAHGLDCVVIGAGPSLENGFETLRKCSDHALLCAAFQALPTLYAGGVKPDIVMLIDQEEAHHHIYEKTPPEWLANITMVYLVCAHKGVLDRYPGTKIPCWTEGGVAATLFPEAFSINPEGNVAVALTKMLHFFGLNRFFFVGQDFGWTDDKSHASGHHAANANIRHETFNIKFGKEKISGKTTTQLVAAWQSLRGYVSQNKMPAFNLYGGGLPILEAETVDHESMLYLIPDTATKKKFEFLQLLSINKPVEGFKYKPRRKELLRDLRKNIQRIEKYGLSLQKNQNRISTQMLQLRYDFRVAARKNSYIVDLMLEVEEMIKDGNYEREDIRKANGIVKEAAKRLEYFDQVVTSLGER